MLNQIKLWIGVAAFAFAVPAFAEEKAESAQPSSASHTTHGEHEHAHGGKDCKHKAEKHGDHTDYEDAGHHHKKDGDHWDECDGPEADAKAAKPDAKAKKKGH